MAKMLKDRYALTAKLGEGGMGIVYQATDTQLDRDVAIKLLPPQLSQDSTFLQRFEREAKAVTSLEHNNIVPVYDFGQDRNQTFLVMRLLKGGDLKKRIENTPLEMKDAIRILRQVGSALDKAHANSIIHRDLKPGNILFDDDDNSFLGDFGIVKLTNESNSFTQTGGTVGTPYYMSPEQIRDPQNIDHRTDIYSLGIILYEMLTGKLPYESTSAFDLQMMHVSNPIPDILEANPNLPQKVKDVINKAMAKDRAERYSSAKALVNDLEIAATAPPPQPAAPEPPPAPEPVVEQTAVVPIIEAEPEPEPEPAVEQSPPAIQAEPEPEPEPTVEQTAVAPIIETEPEPEPSMAAAPPEPEPEPEPVIAKQASEPAIPSPTPTGASSTSAPATQPEPSASKRGIPTWVYLIGAVVVIGIIVVVIIGLTGPDDEFVDEVDEPVPAVVEQAEEQPTDEPAPTIVEQEEQSVEELEVQQNLDPIEFEGEVTSTNFFKELIPYSGGTTIEIR